MFSFVVSKIFSPYYTSSKAFAYSLSKPRGRVGMG